MGMRLFGNSFGRCEAETKRKSKDIGASFLLPTDPDPTKFEIIEYKQGPKFLYVQVKYPNCTNFEGLKILVLDSTIDEVKKLKVLEPHFLSDNKIMARFRPSTQGKILALEMCGLGLFDNMDAI